MRTYIALAFAGMISISAWFGVRGRTAPPPVMAMLQLPGGGRMSGTMVGHEFRQDDLPAIVASADGSLWIAWLSFAGDRDDVVIRHYVDGKWSNLQWVPNTSGDSWLPQIGVDAKNRPWVVWSQQVNNNWDVYGRYYDTARQEWGPLERITRDPLPDINPRLASDGKGRMALVWQGFRGKNSNIFLKTFDGEKWSADVRVTDRAANDWEPAVVVDPQGAAWVAYDSYKNGNYDVFVSKVTGGVAGAEMPVAATPRMEARPTLAIDTGGRLWIAWEEGLPNWGKDDGYWLRKDRVGAKLGNDRRPQVRCLVGGEWKQPGSSIADALPDYTYHPQIVTDGRGSVWVVALRAMDA